MQQTNHKEQSKGSNFFWERHIKKYSESSLTPEEYCLQNGLELKSMIYWKNRLKNEKSEASYVQPLSQTVSKPTRPAALKPVYGNKYKIKAGENFSSDRLKRLIEEIEDS